MYMESICILCVLYGVSLYLCLYFRSLSIYNVLGLKEF